MLSEIEAPVPESTIQADRAIRVWLKSTHLYAAGGALCAVILILALAFIQFERSEARSHKQVHLQQLVKALESQTSAHMGVVEAMLLAMGNSDRDLIDPTAPGRIDSGVVGAMRGYPQLRSVSVLDAQGRVVASTTADNVGITLDLKILGDLPAGPAKATLGPMLGGRDLVDIRRRVPGTPQSNVLPMLVRLNPPSGQRLTLLALVNADFFSLEYESTVDDPLVRASLTDRQGGLLVASSNVRHRIDLSLSHLRVFTEFLPQRDWGSYRGPGVDEQYVITAFAALPKWPMVLLVETSYGDAMAEVMGIEKWTMVVVLALWLTVAVLILVTSLSLKRHAQISRRLNQEVYTSEARSNAVLESAVDAVITIDASGRILAFNPAAEKMFGRRKVDCLGRPMDALLVPSSLQQAHHEGMERYLASRDGPALGRLNRRIETVAMHASGDLFPVELSIVSVEVDGALFFTANIRDISEAQKAKQEIADLLGKYHAVASDLEQQKMALDEHAIVSIVDADEIIIYANQKLVDISGYPKEELLGRKHYEFRHPLGAVVYADLRHKLATAKIWHGELLMRRRDGGAYWVSSTTVPVLDDHGCVRQFITIQTDISELRHAEIALKEARDRELDIGNRIQQSLLAAAPGQQLPGLWLTHFNQASKGIDGDFVDVIALGNRCVDIIVGDVMGKGVPAALLGAATKLQFSRSLAELLASTPRPQPRAIVSAVHQAMTPHLQALDAFVTLAYVRIDLERNLVTWVGCGHEETLLIHGSGESTLLPNQHPPLGILDSSEYAENVMALAPDDVLFLCSDGLTDAVGADGERLGRDIVNQTLRRLVRDHPTPAAALHCLRRELLASTVQLNDDVTMALIMQPLAGSTDARCELPIDLQSINALRRFVAAQALNAGLSAQDAAMFELAGVEVFTNIVRHAKGLLTSAPLELVTHCTAHELVLEVIHLGEAFTPPAEVIEPDLYAFPEGGFGMTIIRSACSRVDFLHHDGVNTVRMTRLIET